MAILLKESSTDDRFELVIRNRQPAFATAAGVLATLTWATLFGALGGSREGYSLILNLATAVLFTHFLLYFSVFRTTIVIDGEQLQVRHMGMVLDIHWFRLNRTDLVWSDLSSVDHPLTGNKLVVWRLRTKDERQKTFSFTLPRLAAGQVIQTIKDRLLT